MAFDVRLSEHMKTRTIFLTITLAMCLLSTGALAQHEHHQDQAAPAATASMDKMCPMMRAGQETAKIVGQLAESFAAIENEKDPAALNGKIAAHGALLKQLQAKVQSQSGMKCDMMDGQKMGGHMMDGKMMGGKMMGGEQKQ